MLNSMKTNENITLETLSTTMAWSITPTFLHHGSSYLTCMTLLNLKVPVPK